MSIVVGSQRVWRIESRQRSPTSVTTACASPTDDVESDDDEVFDGVGAGAGFNRGRETGSRSLATPPNASMASSQCSSAWEQLMQPGPSTSPWSLPVRVADQLGMQPSADLGAAALHGRRQMQDCATGASRVDASPDPRSVAEAGPGPTYDDR